MIYQLPNGKVLYISLEEYLSLTDDELKEVTQVYIGDEPSNKSFNKTTERESINRDIDYSQEDDESDTTGPLDLNNLPDII